MEKEYTKRSIVKSGLFNKDIANALLEDRNYTIEEAEQIIRGYINKVINN